MANLEGERVPLFGFFCCKVNKNPVTLCFVLVTGIVRIQLSDKEWSVLARRRGRKGQRNIVKAGNSKEIKETAKFRFENGWVASEKQKRGMIWSRFLTLSTRYALEFCTFWSL